MKNITALAGLTMVALVAVPTPALGQDFEWSGQLAAGKTLEVKGVNGNVEAHGVSGRTAEVNAMKKGRKSDPATVRIEVVILPRREDVVSTDVDSPTALLATCSTEADISSIDDELSTARE